MGKEEFYKQFLIAFSHKDEDLAKRLVELYFHLPVGDKNKYFHRFLKDGGNGIPTAFYSYVYHRIGRCYLESAGVEPVGVQHHPVQSSLTK